MNGPHQNSRLALHIRERCVVRFVAGQTASEFAADLAGSVRTVRKWVEEMKRLEVPVTYEEIPDGDHARVIAENEAMIGRVFDFFDEAGKKAKTDAKTSAQQDTDREARDAKPGDDSKGGEAATDGKN